MDEINSWERPKTRVEWQLGNKCNYQCSYCHEMFRKGDRSFPSDDLIQEVCKDIIYHYDSLGRDVVFEFFGGEASLIESIPQIGQRLHNYPTNIVLRTNGSAELEWWKEIRKFISKVEISVHKEFADIKHIENVIKILLDTTNHHPVISRVLFPVTHRENHWKWGVENLKFFRQKYNLGELQVLYSDFGKGSSMYYPYSQSQWDEFVSLGGFYPNTDNLLKRSQPSFTGQTCFAGIDTLTIDHAGDVYRSWCRQGPIIGNIFEMPVEWPKNPIICEKEICGNGFDLQARKELTVVR